MYWSNPSTKHVNFGSGGPGGSHVQRIVPPGGSAATVPPGTGVPNPAALLHMVPLGTSRAVRRRPRP